MKQPKMRDLTATIAAIATPPGTGGIAVIRISGTDAVKIADRVFKAKSGKSLAAFLPRTAVYGEIYHEGNAIDDGVAVLFRAPHSYTGEDTVELSCHGGMLVTRTVLASCLAGGAVLAERGEFTRRAFVSGKLSLSDAEAVATLLSADTQAQLTLSSKRARGRLSDALEKVRAELLSLMAGLFATIDFPDEDLSPLSRADIERVLTSTEAALLRLSASYQTGRAVNEGIPTVIAGKPNVGKSTLYNLMAGEDLAIVTDIAGTTRDVLTERVSLGRVLLRVSDTAGIRKTEDPVEKIGVARSRSCMEKAELCILVFDASRPLDQEDDELIDYACTLNAEKIAVINKTDCAGFDMSRVEQSFPHTVYLAASAEDASLAPLAALVNRLFTDERLVLGEDAVLAGARQYGTVNTALACIKSAKEALLLGISEDAVAGDIERALAALGETDGRAVSEEVVGEIFSHFCVGK